MVQHQIKLPMYIDRIEYLIVIMTRLWTNPCRYTRCIRVDNKIRVNGRFNPKSHPSALLNIQRPIFDCIDTGNNRRLPVSTSIHPATASAVGTMKWYAMDVANVQSYIDAAFRSMYKYEAYLFMKNKYVLID